MRCGTSEDFQHERVRRPGHHRPSHSRGVGGGECGGRRSLSGTVAGGDGGEKVSGGCAVKATFLLIGQPRTCSVRPTMKRLRRSPKPATRRLDDNLRTGFCVGTSIVVLERQSEARAHVWQLRGVNAPRPPGELNGALERQTWRRDACAAAARFEHIPIELGVMGRHEADSFEHRAEFWPSLAKRGLIRNLPPGDAMNPGKYKVRAWRPKQLEPAFDDL